MPPTAVTPARPRRRVSLLLGLLGRSGELTVMLMHTDPPPPPPRPPPPPPPPPPHPPTPNPPPPPPTPIPPPLPPLPSPPPPHHPHYNHDGPVTQKKKQINGH